MKLVINSQHVTDWVPEQQKIEGHDAPFIRIDKVDREFYRFCTGESLKWGKRDSKGGWEFKHFPFWDALKRSRNAASQKSFEETRADDDEPAGKKPKKPKIAKQEDAALVPVVTVELQNHDEETVVATMLFGVRGSPLWVKAEQRVIEFIKDAMNHDFLQGYAKSARRPTVDSACQEERHQSVDSARS